jgi:sugar lactone lactonase YvrE
VDSLGNIFIADSGTGRIRKVDALTGVITTVAGGGKGNVLEGMFGDGGPATEALIKLPDGIAVDNEGNLYIATDNRIRKVDTGSGIITTFAGIGERGLEGDGGPATSAAWLNR